MDWGRLVQALGGMLKKKILPLYTVLEVNKGDFTLDKGKQTTYNSYGDTTGERFNLLILSKEVMAVERKQGIWMCPSDNDGICIEK